jgi:arylsulfatase A-like enzyme
MGRFIATSLLRAPTDRFRLIERDDRQRRLCMFRELANMPHTAAPKFVFAHIPSPHWPFLFDQDGNAVSLENLNHDQLKEGYLAQLIYLNGRVTQIVDAILQNSNRDPIIIIQSDHGPAFEFSMDTPSESLYQERMRILNAYYLPNEAKSMLYPSITPVNSLRLVFNYLFATELPLLEDQSYFSTYQTPYQFTNVTKNIVSR